MAGLRSVVASLCLLIWMKVRGIKIFPSARFIGHGIVVGLLFGGEFGLVFVGLEFTLASRGYVRPVLRRLRGAPLSRRGPVECLEGRWFAGGILRGGRSIFKRPGRFFFHSPAGGYIVSHSRCHVGCDNRVYQKIPGPPNGPPADFILSVVFCLVMLYTPLK